MCEKFSSRNLKVLIIISFLKQLSYRGVGGGEGGKVQRISSIDDRWKIDRGRVRIV